MNNANKSRKTTEWENQREQGSILCKDGHHKDRNGKDLTEAEEIKKRWQEYTGELYKKDLHDPKNHDGVITHLEPGIMECEVKWILGSITTNKGSGGDAISDELFQILKGDLRKCCSQEELRWRRSRMGITISPPQMHQKNI